MKEFKTKAGTILPLLDLKGKPYLQVAHRIVWFREEHPEAEIKTEFIQLDKDISICKATIKYLVKGISGQCEVVSSTAHKREDSKGFYDHTEKSETGAIGRALALLGYGTQFCADELNEESRLADSPISPYIKPIDRPINYVVPNDPVAQGDGFAPEGYRIPFGKWAKLSLEEVLRNNGADDMSSYVNYLEGKASKDNKPLSGVVLEFVLRAAEFLGDHENQVSALEGYPF